MENASFASCNFRGSHFVCNTMVKELKIKIDIEHGDESTHQAFSSVSDALGWLETVGMDESFSWGAEEYKRSIEKLGADVVKDIPKKKFMLHMKSYTQEPDLEKECEAHTKEEAAKVFYKNLPLSMRAEWSWEYLVDKIVEVK